MFIQDIIFKLQNFWSEYGCTILQPYDEIIGAATLHPATGTYINHRECNNRASMQ